MTIQAVLFDYDGTLRDSFAEIHRSVSVVLSELGLPTHTLEEFRESFVIPSDPYWKERGVTMSTHEVLDRWRNVTAIEETDLFPDAIPVVQQLKEQGVLTAVLSGDSHDVLVRHATEYGIAPYLDHIEGSLTVKDRAMHGFLKRVGIPKEHAVYVGDSTSDMRDAVAAGVVGVGITRGMDTGEMLRDAGAQIVIQELSEIYHL
jgi:phosphoglycolate phosphatase